MLIAPLIGTLALTIPMAQAAVCADPSAAQGLGARVLQSRLLVAALTCDQRPEYNALMQQNTQLMKNDGSALKAFFVKSYGSEAKSELDAFVTRMANQAFSSSMQNVTAFCMEASQVFGLLLNDQTSSSYQQLRAQFTGKAHHGYHTCEE